MIRTAMKALLRKCAEMSAIGFGLGLSPRGPGTSGSLGGLLAGYLIHVLALQMGPLGSLKFIITTLTLLVLLSAFAWWAIHVTERSWGTHDEGKIVIDEIAGQAIAIAFFTPGVVAYTIGFIFFRILDIWKPGPIGKADEELPGAAGTLVDDLIAGVMAGLLTASVLFLMQLNLK